MNPVSLVKRFVPVLVLVLMAAPGVRAQTIQGVVVEEGTRKPISGVVINLFGRDGSTATAQSNADGGFVLLPRRAGVFRLQVRHVAFAPVDTDTLALAAGEAVELELRLARTAIPLEPLVVTARSRTSLDAFHERRLRGGFGHFITRDEIRAHRGSSATDVLRDTPGVELTTMAACGDNQEPSRCPIVPTTPDAIGLTKARFIVMRHGTGYCYPILVVDGMRMKQIEDAGVDDILRPDMLEGVEVYPRSTGAPPEWADPSGCGVVAFWTRRDVERSGWSWKKLAGGAAFFVGMVLLTR